MNQSLSPVEKYEKNINERAWVLWNKATQIADEIWDAFEDYFVDKITIEECYNTCDENDDFDFDEDDFKA